MKLCVIVINYNGLRFLESYLSSIVIACKENDIDLIIADDNSIDNSINYLKENKFDYTLNGGRNKGFAANVNNGIKYAQQKKDYDYFIIANNDLKFKPGFFKQSLPLVVQRLQSEDNKVGLVGFYEALEDSDQTWQDYNKDNTIFAIKNVSEISGFFFMIHKNLLNSIGYLDEDYFMYGEDNDYFIRSFKAGFKMYKVDLPIRHFSESSSSNSFTTSWYVYRNALLCAQKNEGWGSVIMLILNFAYKIYNPFYKSNHPSNIRITRNGFFLNNYFLIKSIFWNINYYLKHGKRLN